MCQWKVSTYYDNNYCQKKIYLDSPYHWWVARESKKKRKKRNSVFLFLLVEELCVWNEVFVSFQRCWSDYNNKRQNGIVESKENNLSSPKNNGELVSEENIEKDRILLLGKIQNRRRSFDSYNKSNNPFYINSVLTEHIINNNITT